jgi:hypothetical protein
MHVNAIAINKIHTKVLFNIKEKKWKASLEINWSKSFHFRIKESYYNRTINSFSSIRHIEYLFWSMDKSLSFIFLSFFICRSCSLQLTFWCRLPYERSLDLYLGKWWWWSYYFYFILFFSLCHCLMMIVVERMKERQRLIDQQEYSWENKRLIIEYMKLKSRCWETKRRKFHTVHSICNLITLRWRRRTR